mgnify:CR=1 FL=1
MLTKKICPNCGSEDVYMIAGGITGNWICKSCGYSGAVLEKEIIGKERKIKPSNNKKKGANE